MDPAADRALPAGWHRLIQYGFDIMNISRHEQRVLHVLALGGAIHFERSGNGKVASVTCITREGYVLADCSLAVFDRLKRRRLIRSRGGRPYRIAHAGILAVRAQADQR